MKLRLAPLRSTLLCALAGTLVIAGCGKPADTGAPKAGGGGPDKAEAAKPLFTGSAEDLAKEWAKDKDAFNKKYKDQIVQVKGEVMDPQLNPGTAFSIKAWDPPEGATVIFSCYYAKGKATELAAKQKVKVQGKVAGRPHPIGPEIIDCDILEK